jgi:hypothetical protein
VVEAVAAMSAPTMKVDDRRGHTNELGGRPTEHRARCLECRWQGSWTKHLNVALNDGLLHRCDPEDQMTLALEDE